MGERINKAVEGVLGIGDSDKNVVPAFFTAGNPLEGGYPGTVGENVEYARDAGLLKANDNPGGISEDVLRSHLQEVAWPVSPAGWRATAGIELGIARSDISGPDELPASTVQALRFLDGLDRLE